METSQNKNVAFKVFQGEVRQSYGTKVAENQRKKSDPIHRVLHGQEESDLRGEVGGVVKKRDEYRAR